MFTIYSCSPAGILASGGGTAMVVAEGDKSLGTVVDDATIKVNLAAKFLSAGNNLFVNINTTVLDGRVLLTGLVENHEIRIEAVRLVWEVEGIKEVINDDYINPLDIDIMIIPLVGVDCNGFRLGYGGGYFDRALSKVHSSNKKPLIVGLGYDYQICSESFGRNHDIKYDVVITETRILYFD